MIDGENVLRNDTVAMEVQYHVCGKEKVLVNKTAILDYNREFNTNSYIDRFSGNEINEKALIRVFNQFLSSEIGPG